MAVPFGGKTMIENAEQVFGWDTDAIIDDRDFDPATGVGEADGKELVRAGRGVAGLFGVAQEVNEDLEDFMFLDKHRGQDLELPNETDVVAVQGIAAHAQAVFNEGGEVQEFRDAGGDGVALLHRDNLLDVVDILPKGSQFENHRFLVGEQVFRKQGEVSGQSLAFGVGSKKRAEFVVVLAQQADDFGQAGSLGLFDAIRHEAGRDIDAVEDIADVMEDVRGHFGHSGAARSLHQLQVQSLHCLFAPFPIGDVAKAPNAAVIFSMLVADG